MHGITAIAALPGFGALRGLCLKAGGSNPPRATNL